MGVCKMWDEMRNMAVYREFCQFLGFDPGLPMFFGRKSEFYDFIYAYSGVGKIKIGKREDAELLMFLINAYTDPRVIKYDLGMFNMFQLKKLKRVVEKCFEKAKNCGSNIEWIEWCKSMLGSIDGALKIKLENRRIRKAKRNKNKRR
jgi:hypothetical protein